MAEKLVAQEAELLENLAEECAEVIQECMKALRHGLQSCHPATEIPNSYKLAIEVGQLKFMVERVQTQLLATEWVTAGYMEKMENFPKYSHHQRK